MLTPQEFHKQWEHERFPLITIPQDAVDSLNIPQEAKQFLAEVGVPEYFFLGDPIDVNLPKLPHSFPGTKNLPSSYERYRAFGDIGYQCYACIDEMAAGRIVYVSIREGPPEVIFMNSSIQQLAECWLIAEKYIKLIDAGGVWSDADLRNKYAHLYEAELHNVDQAAFEDEYSIWPIRIEGLREGRIE